MSCYLIILYRKHCIFYRTLFNCTNRIQQALQLFFVIFVLLLYVLLLPKWNWPVCDVFLDLFSHLFSLVFLKLCLSLLLNMQNNEKRKLWGNIEIRGKEKLKKTICNSEKEFGKWSFINDVRKKSLKFAKKFLGGRGFVRKSWFSGNIKYL